MTDLVERLRTQGADAFAKQYSLGMFKLCAEAADEIERLRIALDEADTIIGNDVLKQMGYFRAASEWRDISTALEPFVRAAEIIASRPQDYKDRIVAIGGLATAADLTKRHFSDLLTALPAPPQRNEVTK